jgi:hypothetical protein
MSDSDLSSLSGVGTVGEVVSLPMPMHMVVWATTNVSVR